MKPSARALGATLLAASAFAIVSYVARAQPIIPKVIKSSVSWENAPSPQTHPATTAGSRVVRDPVTGEVRAPLPGEFEPGPSEPTRPSQVVHVPEGVFLIAGDDLLSDMSASKRAGALAIDCGTGGPHGAAGHNHVEMEK